MRLTLRFLGLDLLDLNVDTDAACAPASDDPGDCTTYPVGFTMPDPAPYELDCPERG